MSEQKEARERVWTKWNKFIYNTTTLHCR